MSSRIINKLGLVLCAVGLALVAVNATPSLSKEDHEAWLSFKQEHGKQYDTLQEEMMRRNLFIERKRRIEQWNAKESKEAGYTKGINHMSDWTVEEFNQLKGFKLESKSATTNRTSYTEEMLRGPPPKEVDWRKTGSHVTDVRDQGKCNACYAFVAAGILEGQETKYAAESYKKYGLKQLSVQQMIDCPVIGGPNHGCNGGDPVQAFDDLFDGIETEDSYKYTGETGNCMSNKTRAFMKVAYGEYYYDGMYEVELEALLANYGPVGVAVQVVDDWLDYKSGVYKKSDCGNKQKELNYLLLLVGYGTDAKDGDYWILKNQWSKSWGEGGYMRIRRDKENLCGVMTLPFAATFLGVDN